MPQEQLEAVMLEELKGMDCSWDRAKTVPRNHLKWHVLVDALCSSPGVIRSDDHVAFVCIFFQPVTFKRQPSKLEFSDNSECTVHVYVHE